jgi:predicted NBD/HSP70 family sugar kinase
VPAIKREIYSALMSGRQTVINETIGGDINRISLDSVIYALEQKDPLVCGIIDGISEKLAVGINNVINIFDPQAVVIGGEITKLGLYSLDRIKAHLARIRLWPEKQGPEVSFTSLTEDPVNLGGAKYLLDRLFRSDINVWDKMVKGDEDKC